MSLRDGTFKRERWKYFNRYYHVSDRGRVYSDLSHKILRPGNDGRGYKIVRLKTRNGSFKAYKVHRLVAELFLPNPNNLPEVNHINGIKTDNRTSNIEWTTSSQNMQHAYDTGLREKALSRKQIEEVKNLYENTMLSTHDLADKFKVSQRTIQQCTKDITSRFNKRKKRHSRISKETKNEIRKKYSDGSYTQTQLAENYDVSKQSISEIVKGIEPFDRKISGARLSNNERAHLNDLYRTGLYSQRELARLFGISSSSVWYYIKCFEEEHE